MRLQVAQHRHGDDHQKHKPDHADISVDVQRLYKSLPRRVETGFAIIDKDNVDDPAVSRFIYQVPGK